MEHIWHCQFKACIHLTLMYLLNTSNLYGKISIHEEMLPIYHIKRKTFVCPIKKDCAV